jgi:hypothetical protein
MATEGTPSSGTQMAIVKRAQATNRGVKQKRSAAGLAAVGESVVRLLMGHRAIQNFILTKFPRQALGAPRTAQSLRERALRLLR